MSNDPIVIVSAARTPIGAFQGDFATLTSPQLGGLAIKAAVERAGIPAERVEEVIMGCVLPAALGQAPARQAALNAGLPLAAGCTTVNKVCGSGMKATLLAHDLLIAGSNEVMIAGGMESMTNAPYMLSKARGGYRLGHGQVFDHMFMDGLEDAYAPETRGRLMGTFAEDCAESYGFTREEQDQYAIESTTRARDAISNGAFAWEITPVTLSSRKGDRIVKDDEQPPKANIDKISSLKPAFRKEGTVTAANSSSISDGAAALMLMRRSMADKFGVKPLAILAGHTTHATEPRLFPVAPVGAMQKLLEKTGWKTGDVDLWEINEAFAVVTMAAIRDLRLAHDKVNIHGGACALGHPIGASGARIIVTLLGALKKTGGKRGIASLCIGGGEATALAIEMN
jgi:acetyl-CoA C-acetyltransferase